jgi:type IV pilus assembly protein PilX
MKHIYQKGAALFVGLLMLTVMSLIAVTSMQSSTLQELMSGNMADQVTAFEAAESALRAAEEFLDNGALNLSAFDGNKSDGLLSNLYDEVWNAIDWSTESVQAPSVDGATSNPRYVIQYLGPVTPEEDVINVNNAYGEGTVQPIAQYFRITARGTGGSDNSMVILESVYGISN